MIRKLIVAWVALITALCGLEVAALGLSNINVVSKLNQPLNAQVKILSIPRGDINNLRVSLAPAEAFRRAGLEFPVVLNTLKFNTQSSNERGSQAILHISTRQPLKEPFLNFLIEINWPSGRIRREYTALLDPPLHEAKVAEAMTPVITQGVNSLSQRQPARINTKKLQPLNARASSTPTSYTVSSGDTLSKIARKTHTDKSLSFNQHMKNLHRNNPHAFIRNNMNLIKSGVVLRVPAPANNQNNLAVAQYTPPTQANRVTATSQESAAFNQNRLTTPAAPAQPRLRLASVSEAKDNPNRAGNANRAQTSAAPSELRALRRQLQTLEEENFSIREENKDLKSRMNETSDLVKTMKKQLDGLNRLIELQNGELAKLQRQLKDSGVMSASAESIKPIAELEQQAKQEADTTESTDSPTQASSDNATVVMTDETDNATTAENSDSTDSAMNTAEDIIDENDTENSEAVAENEQMTSDDPEIIGAETTENNQSDSTIAETGLDATDENGEGNVTEDEARKLIAESEALEGIDENAQDQPKGENILAEAPDDDFDTEPLEPIDTGLLSSVNYMTGGAVDTANEMVEQVPGGWLSVGGALGGLLLLLLLLMMLLGKRRKAKQVQEEEEIQAELERLEAEENTELDDSEFDIDVDSKDGHSTEDDLDDLMNQIKQENQDSEDLDTEVLEEVDVYLAYENYDQAIELLNIEIEKHPEQPKYRVKMLEVLALANHPQEFETHAKVLRTQVNAEGPDWDKAVSLWNDMNTGRELLADDKYDANNTAAIAAGAALGIGAGTAAATMLSDDETSDDDDIANLLAQVDSEIKDDSGLDMDGLSGGDSLDSKSLLDNDEDELLASSLHADDSSSLDMDDALSELDMDSDDDAGLDLDLGDDDGLDGLDLGDELDAGDDLDIGSDDDAGLDLDLGDDDGLDGLDLGDELDAGDDLDMGSDDDAGLDLDLGDDDGLDGLDLGDELDAGDDLDLGDELDAGDDLDLGDDDGLDGLDLGDELDAGDDLDLGDELDAGDDLDLGDDDGLDGLDLGDELDAGDDLDLGNELDAGEDLDLGEDGGLDDLDLGDELDAGDDLGEDDGLEGLDLGNELDAGDDLGEDGGLDGLSLDNELDADASQNELESDLKDLSADDELDAGDDLGGLGDELDVGDDLDDLSGLDDELDADDDLSGLDD
uniref:FimV/HubP family polar landmark protein n=1 Tax=Candidatus Albibeggiatoa sp. nov. BB20 TaxID=3162723 RepID=UPI0033654ACE